MASWIKIYSWFFFISRIGDHPGCPFSCSCGFVHFMGILLQKTLHRGKFGTYYGWKITQTFHFYVGANGGLRIHKVFGSKIVRQLYPSPILFHSWSQVIPVFSVFLVRKSKKHYFQVYWSHTGRPPKSTANLRSSDSNDWKWRNQKCPGPFASGNWEKNEFGFNDLRKSASLFFEKSFNRVNQIISKVRKYFCFFFVKSFEFVFSAENWLGCPLPGN